MGALVRPAYEFTRRFSPADQLLRQAVALLLDFFPEDCFYDVNVPLALLFGLRSMPSVRSRSLKASA